jgi:hypothetical protein
VIIFPVILNSTQRVFSAGFFNPSEFFISFLRWDKLFRSSSIIPSENAFVTTTGFSIKCERITY